MAQRSIMCLSNTAIHGLLLQQYTQLNYYRICSRHDIAEMLLMLALNTNQLINQPTWRVWVTRRVHLRKQELLTLHEHLGSPLCFLSLVTSIVAHRFRFMCCISFCLSSFCVLCQSCPCLCVVYCANVARVSGLCILDYPLDFL